METIIIVLLHLKDVSFLIQTKLKAITICKITNIKDGIKATLITYLNCHWVFTVPSVTATAHQHNWTGQELAEPFRSGSRGQWFSELQVKLCWTEGRQQKRKGHINPNKGLCVNE